MRVQNDYDLIPETKRVRLPLVLVLIVWAHKSHSLVFVPKETGKDRAMCLKLHRNGWVACQIGVSDWKFVKISPVISCVVIQLLA